MEITCVYILCIGIDVAEHFTHDKTNDQVNIYMSRLGRVGMGECMGNYCMTGTRGGGGGG